MLRKFYACAFACASMILSGCGSGGSSFPPHPIVIPPAGCPGLANDFLRFHKPGTTSLDEWVFSPVDCPTKDRVSITVSPFARFGSGVWMTGEYAAGTIITVGANISRGGGQGVVTLRAAWQTAKGQTFTQDIMPAMTPDRRMAITATAPTVGYMIIGFYVENTGVDIFRIDLSDLKISPAPIS